MTSKSGLNPWRVLCAKLFELSSYDIPAVIEKTGLVVDWSLTEEQNYSDKYRKAAYRPRINSAYDQLEEPDRLRVANITASEIIAHKNGEELNADLEKIGWHIDETGHLAPASAEISELFFPVGTQHDAYVEIRRIFQSATVSLSIIDPYVDSSLFTALKTVDGAIKVELLTSKVPPDFLHESKKLLSQHPNIRLSIKKSKEFHDRFIVVDNKECWHVGASIKDAGIRVFMLNKVEDDGNRAALIAQLNNAWSLATEESIGAKGTE